MTQDRKKKEILYFYGGIVFIAVLVSIGGLLYRNGYRFNGFQITKAGNLEISAYETGAKIFIDNKLQKITDAEEETIQFNNIAPGLHTIAVTKNGFFPWEKEIEVKQFSITKISSFLSPANITPEKIIDPIIRDQAIFLLKNSAKATTTPKKIVGNTTLWADSTSVYLEWMGSSETIPNYFCTDQGECSNGPIAIFHSATKITSADFYKYRENVFLVASGNKIETIEIDGTQGIPSHDLYTGNEPQFYKIGENILYIKDGKDILKMEI